MRSWWWRGLPPLALIPVLVALVALAAAAVLIASGASDATAAMAVPVAMIRQRIAGAVFGFPTAVALALPSRPSLDCPTFCEEWPCPAG